MNRKLAAGIGILGLALGLTLGCSDDDGGGEGGDGGTGGGTAGSGGGTAGSGGGTAGSGGSTSANGVTPCGNFPDLIAKTCQAGQYCADEGFSECKVGCLSNTNCADNQTCEKAAGADVGACQNVTSGVSCADFCAKITVCDSSITMAQCNEVCPGFNDTCKKCVVDGNCPAIIEGSCDAACGFSGD